MKSALKIATWNIAGARRSKTLRSFDYSPEDIGYFASQLNAILPDVICIQENHTNESRSIAREIAEQLGYNNVYEIPASPSHIDPAFNLGNAIISRLPFVTAQYRWLPAPWFPLRFSDGRPAVTHNKNFQIAAIGEIQIINASFFPMKYFGYGYDTEPGNQLTRLIEQSLLQLDPPFVFCGDFNFTEIEQIYPQLFHKFKLKEALPRVMTRPTADPSQELRLDHILFTPNFSVESSRVIPTETDHYLCVADLCSLGV